MDFRPVPRMKRIQNTAIELVSTCATTAAESETPQSFNRSFGGKTKSGFVDEIELSSFLVP